MQLNVGLGQLPKFSIYEMKERLYEIGTFVVDSSIPPAPNFCTRPIEIVVRIQRATRELQLPTACVRMS